MMYIVLFQYQGFANTRGNSVRIYAAMDCPAACREGGMAEFIIN
jgi:hypothetical protein